MRIVLLAVALLLILLLALASRTRRPDPSTRLAGVDPLAAQLQRWTADGLLSPEQATAILGAERARLPRAVPPARPASVMAELLGYLGGTLAVVGAGLLAARFWPDLALWARLSLVGLAAVALWAAGALVPEQAAPALWRLRGVLWLGSSAAVAFLAALVGTDMLDLDGEAVALLAGLVTAIHASVLWWRRPRPLQQLACLAGLAGGLPGGGSCREAWYMGWIGVVPRGQRTRPALRTRVRGGWVTTASPRVAAGTRTRSAVQPGSRP
jgi:hypothetical protein